MLRLFSIVVGSPYCNIEFCNILKQLVIFVRVELAQCHLRGVQNWRDKSGPCATPASTKTNSHCVWCNQPKIDSSSKCCDNLALANADVIYELLISLKCYVRSDKNITVSFQIDLDSRVVWCEFHWFVWNEDGNSVWIWMLLLKRCIENKLCEIWTGHSGNCTFGTGRSYNTIFFVYGNALVAKRVEAKPHAHNNLWRVANIWSFI